LGFKWLTTNQVYLQSIIISVQGLPSCITEVAERAYLTSLAGQQLVDNHWETVPEHSQNHRHVPDTCHRPDLDLQGGTQTVAIDQIWIYRVAQKGLSYTTSGLIGWHVNTYHRRCLDQHGDLQTLVNRLDLDLQGGTRRLVCNLSQTTSGLTG